MRILLAIGLLSTAAIGGTVPVGVAKVDVTPDFPVMLSGYASRNSESKSASGKLWVKALAIGADSDGPAILMTVDGLGVPDALTAEIARRLKSKGIAREKLAIGASHTHSAPFINGCAPIIFGRDLTPEEQSHVDRYTKLLTDAMEKAALDALKARIAMSLAHSEGRASFALNRRRSLNKAWDELGEVPEGSVDHALPMLRGTDESGKIRVILTNYACHCTTLNPAINTAHGDWAGYAQEIMEKDHPDAIAMTLVGCGADANPKGRDAGQVGGKSASDVAEAHGKSIATEVNRLLEGPVKSVDGPPVTHLIRVALPMEAPPDRSQIEETISKSSGHERKNAVLQLQKLKKLGKLPTEIEYPVQTWRFGDDLVMVFLAGEVVVDYALGLKKEFDPGRIWVVGYANDSPCYIPSERILREGGYEGGGAMIYYGWPSKFKPGLEERIRSAVRSQIPSSYRRNP